LILFTKKAKKSGGTEQGRWKLFHSGQAIPDEYHNTKNQNYNIMNHGSGS